MRLILTILSVAIASTCFGQVRNIQSSKERMEYYLSVFSIADSTAEISKAQAPNGPAAMARRRAVKTAAKKTAVKK